MNLDDELAIRNLIARVSWFQDKWMSKDEYLSNYTQDCVWQVEGDIPYQGHDGLSNRLQFVLDVGMAGRGLPSRHCVTSLWVEPDGENPNIAVARSHCIMMVLQADGSPTAGGMGDYIDVCRRENGVWRIASRFIGNVHSVTAKFDENRDHRKG